MKTLMQEISRNGHSHKKAKIWNMAHFQSRRWKQAAEVELKPKPSATETGPTNNPSEITPSPQTPACPATLTNDSVHVPVTQAEPLQPSLPDISEHLVNRTSSIVNSHARVGKVARLPENIRFEVNHLLRHNVPYSQICEKLAQLGHPEIIPQNISTWKQGGFTDWLRQQQEQEIRLGSLKALERCTRAVDIDSWQQKAVLFAAEKFALIMAEFSHERAVEVLYEQPELLPKYIAAMTALSRCTTELAKSFSISQDREATLRQQLDLSPAAGPVEEETSELSDPSHLIKPAQTLSNLIKPDASDQPVSSTDQTSSRRVHSVHGVHAAHRTSSETVADLQPTAPEPDPIAAPPTINDPEPTTIASNPNATETVPNQIWNHDSKSGRPRFRPPPPRT